MHPLPARSERSEMKGEGAFHTSPANGKVWHCHHRYSPTPDQVVLGVHGLALPLAKELQGLEN
jgi:hypothetical protein